MKFIAFFVLFLFHITPVLASDGKYQHCYDLGITQAIQDCMLKNKRLSDSELSKALKAFVEKSKNSVFDDRKFIKRVYIEDKEWTAYIKKKCDLISSSNTLDNSHAYWIEYFECMSIEYDNKIMFYKNFKFD